MAKNIKLQDGEYNLNLSIAEDAEALKNLLNEAYYKSGDTDNNRNVNLHFATTKACYSGEINLTVNKDEGDINTQINDQFNWIIRKDEPTKHLMVASRAIEGIDSTIELNLSI
jgi:hypothetical protein